MNGILHLYEDHLTGEIYWLNDELSDEDLYCEVCRDVDNNLGQFKNSSGLDYLLKINYYEKETIKKLINKYEKEVGKQ